MQPYVHPFHVPVMMNVPIAFGIMQAQNNNNSPVQMKAQYSPQTGAMSHSPYKQGCENYSLAMHNPTPFSPHHVNQNYSPQTQKKQDPSVVIIDYPTSPTISDGQEEQIQFHDDKQVKNGQKEPAGVGKKRGEKKLNEKRDQKNLQAQEEMLSSTSLGNRVARPHLFEQQQQQIQQKIQQQQLHQPQGQELHQNTSTPNPATMMNTAMNSGDSNYYHMRTRRSPDSQNHQNNVHIQQKVIIQIDSDGTEDDKKILNNNDDNNDFHQCILVSSENNEEISEKEDQVKVSLINERKNKRKYIQKEQSKDHAINQYQHYCNNFKNNIIKSNIFKSQSFNNQNALDGTNDYENEEPSYYYFEKLIKQKQQENQSLSQQNQYFSPQKQQQLTVCESPLKGSPSLMISNHSNNQDQKQICSTSQPSSSFGSEIMTCTRKEYMNSLEESQTNGRRNNKVQMEDKSKRERKYNSRYNNEDFISGEYMYVMKRASNKRILNNESLNLQQIQQQNQLQPSLRKKSRRNNPDSVSVMIKSAQKIVDLIQSSTLFEKQNISRVKSQFLHSVKPSEITRAAYKAQKNVFTLTIQKKKPQRKSSDDSQLLTSYFPTHPNQKFIEEQFEEDTILLVNNNNQNVEIKVKKTPLDKSAALASKKANKDGQIMDPLAKIKNRFDEFARNKYFSQINFIKDYKSGYAPIDIQNQQEKELDEMLKNEYPNEETHKQHFIRRKQSQNINLKRSCGVSYVKQPESKQENVSQIYERLPQLVFQCSNGQPKMLEHEYLYEKLYQKLFTNSNQWLLCAYFESEDESLMRDYLLYPEKRWSLCKGKYFVVRSINDIWPLFIEKFFMCVHFFYDSKELIKCPSMREFTVEEVQNIVKYSNIQLGLLFKKSINGKKAFKKSLGEAFLGDIENHPSSKDPQAKKKGKKAKNVTNTEETKDNKDNNEEVKKDVEENVNKNISDEINKDNQNKKQSVNKNNITNNDNIANNAHQTSPQNSDTQQQPPLQMNKNQINKFFKEVKSKLKQDKFLKDLPLFRKKIEDIQKYLLPYMKRLNSQETVFPAQEVIKSISDLETNDEKAEALLEMMEHIQEQINDEDYKIPQQPIETSKRMSTRKDSLKQSNSNSTTPSKNIPTTTPSKKSITKNQTSTPSKNSLSSIEQSNETFNSLLQNKNNNDQKTDIHSSEIDIEIEESQKNSSNCISNNNQSSNSQNNILQQNNNKDSNTNINNTSDEKEQLVQNQNQIENNDKIEIEENNVNVNQVQQENKVISVEVDDAIKITEEKIEIEEDQQVEDNKQEKENVKVIDNLNEVNVEDIIQEKKEEDIEDNNTNKDLNISEQVEEIEVKEEKIENDLDIIKDVTQINDQNTPIEIENNENNQQIIDTEIKEEEENIVQQQEQIPEQIQVEQVIQNDTEEKVQSEQNDQLEINKKSEVAYSEVQKDQETKIEQEITSTTANKDDSINKEIQIEKEVQQIEVEEEQKNTNKPENNDNNIIQEEVVKETTNTNKTNNIQSEQIEASTNDVVQMLSTTETQNLKKETLICKEILDYIDRDISSKNINTLSAKLELYVEEKGWKGSSQMVKSLLSTFILYAKDQFEKLALEMMNVRFEIVREENETKLIETLKNIRFITKNSTKRKPIYENYTSMLRSKWDFNENNLVPYTIDNNLFSKKEVKVNEEKLRNETESITIGKLIDKEENYSILKRGDLSMPLYYISTRDSFAFDLIEKISTCNFNGRSFTKTEYFFDPDNHPTNFKSFVDSFPNYRVGATLYTGFFSHQELLSIEDSCYDTEVKSFQRHYFPMTAQMTCTAQKIRRTKFFFGSRYIWTRQQLSEPHSFVGAGVRKDVSEPPAWMRRKVVGPLEQAGILPNGFINSLALNVYHDGKEGLAQHFDDATRFRQPIFTFKLFSDARLSFGSQLYGFCNSAFVIPMPRGSVLKLEENSYAANGIKHCVRPCDMSGKNATIIMRQMHHKVVNEAHVYDEYVDLPTWISTLSSKEDSVPYGDQKEIEAEFLMRRSGQSCS